MDREKIILYSEKKDNLGVPELSWQGRGKGAGLRRQAGYVRGYQAEIITECRFTITESACPPLKACAALAAERPWARR